MVPSVDLLEPVMDTLRTLRGMYVGESTFIKKVETGTQWYWMLRVRDRYGAEYGVWSRFEDAEESISVEYWMTLGTERADIVRKYPCAYQPGPRLNAGLLAYQEGVAKELMALQDVVFGTKFNGRFVVPAGVARNWAEALCDRVNGRSEAKHDRRRDPSWATYLGPGVVLVEMGADSKIGSFLCRQETIPGTMLRRAKTTYTLNVEPQAETYEDAGECESKVLEYLWGYWRWPAKLVPELRSALAKRGISMEYASRRSGGFEFSLVGAVNGVVDIMFARVEDDYVNIQTGFGDKWSGYAADELCEWLANPIHHAGRVVDYSHEAGERDLMDSRMLGSDEQPVTNRSREEAWALARPVVFAIRTGLGALVARRDFCHKYGIAWSVEFPGGNKVGRSFTFAVSMSLIVSYARRMLPYAAAKLHPGVSADRVVSAVTSHYRGFNVLLSVDERDEQATFEVAERLLSERYVRGGGFQRIDALVVDAGKLGKLYDDGMRGLGGSEADMWNLSTTCKNYLFVCSIAEGWRAHFRAFISKYPIDAEDVFWNRRELVDSVRMLVVMGQALAAKEVQFELSGFAVVKDRPLRLEPSRDTLPIPLDGEGGVYTFPMPAEMQDTVYGHFAEDGDFLQGLQVDDVLEVGCGFWSKAVHACRPGELRLFVPSKPGVATWSMAPEFAARVVGDLQALLAGIEGV